MLLIHAINPYGFAWDRRVTQEGCDLNRNFIDFTASLPRNEGYDALADSLVPSALEGPVFATAEATIENYRSTYGEAAYRKARTTGQYRHPTGMFFGGFGPTVARETLERIVSEYNIAPRRLVMILDYHTGLGPYGYGELQCEQRACSDISEHVTFLAIRSRRQIWVPHRPSFLTARRMITGSECLVIATFMSAWNSEPTLRRSQDRSCALTTGSTRIVQMRSRANSVATSAGA